MSAKLRVAGATGETLQVAEQVLEHLSGDVRAACSAIDLAQFYEIDPVEFSRELCDRYSALSRPVPVSGAVRRHLSKGIMRWDGPSKTTRSCPCPDGGEDLSCTIHNEAARKNAELEAGS